MRLLDLFWHTTSATAEPAPIPEVAGTIHQLPVAPHVGQFSPVPIRYSLSEWEPTKDQRYVLRRNARTIVQVYGTFTDCPNHTDHDAIAKEWYWVRHKWPKEKHVPFSPKHHFLAIGDADTGKALAGVLFDAIPEGIKLHCFYYDTGEIRSRSLGTFAVLKMFAYAKEHGHPYLTTGLWHPGQRTAYKTDFRPCDLKLNGRWMRYKPA